MLRDSPISVSPDSRIEQVQLMWRKGCTRTERRTHFLPAFAEHFFPGPAKREIFLRARKWFSLRRIIRLETGKTGGVMISHFSLSALRKERKGKVAIYEWNYSHALALAPVRGNTGGRIKHAHIRRFHCMKTGFSASRPVTIEYLKSILGLLCVRTHGRRSGEKLHMKLPLLLRISRLHAVRFT